MEAASAGDLVASLEHLERLGVVKECGIDEQRERLVEAYLGFAVRRETALVVSQTRAEVREINEAVRRGVAPTRGLREADTIVTALEQIDLTAAQKADPGHYPAESCIVFDREFQGCPRGSKGALVAVTPAGLAVEVEGRIKRVRRSFSIGSPSVARRRSRSVRAIGFNSKRMRSPRMAKGSPMERSSLFRPFCKMARSGLMMAVRCRRATGSSSVATQSRPTAHRARPSITSSSPTQRCGRPLTHSSGM